jgi:hypothetical protein
LSREHRDNFRSFEKSALEALIPSDAFDFVCFVCSVVKSVCSAPLREWNLAPLVKHHAPAEEGESIRNAHVSLAPRVKTWTQRREFPIVRKAARGCILRQKHEIAFRQPGHHDLVRWLSDAGWQCHVHGKKNAVPFVADDAKYLRVEAVRDVIDAKAEFF